MKNIKSEYKNFLEDVQKNIKNKEDLNYITERFTFFVDVMLKQFKNIEECENEKIKEIESKYNILEEKTNQMQQILSKIETDIYAEDGFDFEIICPYCDNEFVIDMEEDKTEIECPECKNSIELDWSGNTDEYNSDGGCQGNCGGCGHDCEDNEEDDDM